jgi:hypothetical protein
MLPAALLSRFSALPPNPGLGAEDAGQNFFALAASM